MAQVVNIDKIVKEALDAHRLNEAISTPTNTPADVKNLSKAQSTATTVQNRAKAINNIQEFPGAFENWFKTLGFQPGKISKSAIRTQVEKVLTNLGYK
jgi:predicted ATPase